MRVPLQRIRSFCTAAVGLLPNHKEIAEVFDTRGAQPVTGFNHGGDDSLRIAGAATVQKVVVFPNGQYRWNRIDVRTEDEARGPGKSEHVEAIFFDRLLLDSIATILQPPRQEATDLALAAGDGRNAHQLRGQLEHKLS